MRLTSRLRFRITSVVFLAAFALPSALTAQVTFRIGSVTTAPGASEVTLPISIEVLPGTGLVRGWQLAVRYDPGVLAGVLITNPRPADRFKFVPEGGFVDAGLVATELFYQGDEAGGITPEDDGVIAELRFCVLPGAAPGVHPVEIAPPVAESWGNGLTFVAYYTIDGRIYHPLTEPGSVTVEGPPISGGSCPPDAHETSPSVPPELLPTFRLGDATVAPGALNVKVPITIDVPPGAGRVSAWTILVRYDPVALGNVRIDTTRPGNGGGYVVDAWEFAEPGTVGFFYYYGTLDGISSENDGLIAWLRFCVLPAAPPGPHTVEFIPEAATRLGAHRPPQAMSYTSEGFTYFRPPAEAGTVTVAGAPLDEGECLADGREPPEDPPRVTADYRLVGASAVQGGSARIPFIIRSSGEVWGFAFSVDFDEELLRAAPVEKVFQKPDGSAWDFEKFALSNSNNVPGNAGVDEGFIAGTGVFSLNERVTLPADTDNEVLAFHFDVLPGAPLGTTEIRFVDGAVMPSGSIPIQNVVTAGEPMGTARPETEIAPVFVTGRLQIVPDISIFIRGDSNGDATVNITDPLATLGFLFHGSSRPHCLDAADANDDGKVDVSDPIATLGFLFSDPGPLPPPGGTPGEDPTPDSLRCSRLES